MPHSIFELTIATKPLTYITEFNLCPRKLMGIFAIDMNWNSVCYKRGDHLKKVICIWFGLWPVTQSRILYDVYSWEHSTSQGTLLDSSVQSDNTQKTRGSWWLNFCVWKELQWWLENKFWLYNIVEAGDFINKDCEWFSPGIFEIILSIDFQISFSKKKKVK